MVARKSRIRRSAEETRQIMLESGIEQLEREGLSFGLEHVTLETACIQKDLPRSSSHAAWSIDDDYTPQTTYQRAVLKKWLDDREGLMFEAAAEKALANVFEQFGDNPTRGEIIRAGVQAVVMAAVSPDDVAGVGSGFLSTDMAIKHALASQPPDERDPEIAEWVSESEIQIRTRRIDTTYRPLAEMLALVPRPEYGDAAFEHIALAIGALTEGIALRHLIIPDRQFAVASIREGDERVPYTLVAVCVEALVDTFFMPAETETE